LTNQIETPTQTELLARFKEIQKHWPYDTSKPMTDKQLTEQGAVNVTDDNKGFGIIAGEK